MIIIVNTTTLDIQCRDNTMTTFSPVTSELFRSLASVINERSQSVTQ